jgi:4-hydroxybenzoate polyprenyltransferase
MAMTRRSRKKRATSGEESGVVLEPTPPAAEAPVASPDTTTERPLASVATSTPEPQRRAPRRLSVGNLGPVLLLRAAHPRQAFLTAAGVAAAAAVAGRSSRELGLVLATVLVGQAVLGWHNDLVDRKRDLAHETSGKPVALGRIDPGTVWFTLICGVLLVVPLSIANGVTAGSAYLLSLAVGLMGNVVLRKGWLSWLPWATSFALLPAFLSYGGWGGDAMGDPPEISITVLAGLLGIGVHFLLALPGLVGDNADGYRHLPLRVALKIGATRLLVVSSVYTALVLVGLLAAGNAVGLAQ